jgi:uncharacterized protein
MNIADLVARSTSIRTRKCRAGTSRGRVRKPFEDAASQYFKAGKRPTIARTIAYYRERKIGLVMFPVDSEFETGVRRIRSDEVAEARSGIPTS